MITLFLGFPAAKCSRSTSTRNSPTASCLCIVATLDTNPFFDSKYNGRLLLESPGALLWISSHLSHSPNGRLSMYKFQRINDGPMRGCYHHPNFERNRFDLIEKINRKDRDGSTDGSDTAEAKKQSKTPLKHQRTTATGAAKASGVAPSASNDAWKGDTASYSDHTASDDEKFELIDFSADDNLNKDVGNSSIRSSTGSTPRTKPQMMTPNSMPPPTHQPQGVFRTMRQMSVQGGLFDVREESKDGLRSSGGLLPLVSSISNDRSNVRPQPQHVVASQPLPFLSDAPADILDEIITTFGKQSKGR